MNNVNINVQCECYHRRGLLYYAWPLAWGRPCRRCRRMMNRGVVVVPQVTMPVQSTNTVMPVQTTTTVMPAQCATHWQMQQPMQQQQMPMQMQMEPQIMSALPPKYDQAVAAN